MSETRIAEAPATGMVILRGDLRSGAIASAVQGAVGLSVPETRRYLRGDRGSALWFSPDELLLLVPPGQGSAIAEHIAERLRGEHFLAADVSDARSRFLIEGPGAREVLAKGAPVDLHPAAFGPGDLRRTRLAQIAVAFWCTGPEHFELVCFRSLAAHVRLWLDTAAAPGGAVGFFPKAG